MILAAQSIRSRRHLITPFEERGVFEGLSYGVGPHGYDVRIDQDIVLSPCWWPFGRFKLASTIERFNIDTDLCPKVHDKSTWARRGVFVQNTVIEAGWSGYLTLELTNDSWWFRKIKRGMPIAQIVFHKLDEPTDSPYRGKYQGQERGPQKARLEQARRSGSS